MINISQIRERSKQILQGLSPLLTYHSLDHTLSVVDSCLNIAAHENIENPNDLLILEAAAWLHDSGFLRTYHEHEIASCAIVQEMLPEAGATSKEIDKICKLIMGTRIPQQPSDHLGFILCDADLDYLGGPDFFPIAESLRQEWKSHGLLQSDEAFIQSEIYFLTQHRYFTHFSQQHREPVKRMHLKNLMLTQRQKQTV